jgi:LysR family transcriptional regulator, glycine cleavage system transcriptional activator
MAMRPRLPSLTSLRNFEVVARHLSFTKAAQELSVTQAAVSHQIKALEDELNTRLFVRAHPGIQLTKSGELLLRVARNAFDELATASAQIKQMSTSKPNAISLCVRQLFAYLWLAPRLPAYLKRHPETEFFISSGHLDTRLHFSSWPSDANPKGDAANRYNMVIASGTEPPAGYASDLIFRADTSPVCHPNLAKSLNIDRGLQSLKNVILLSERPVDVWPELFFTFGESDLVCKGKVYFDDPATLIQVGLRGYGVMLGAPMLLHEYFTEGSLVEPFGPAFRVCRNYYLICDETDLQNPAVAAFRLWLLSEAREFERSVQGESSQ